ncbi:hypothetical protein E2562_004439 [Oryza meyeriana var. granulata]|uniref:Uncharacterized protein n=1 Tax=Oryza meyeriana var. granulata TaxID=110450 RepID=A0A6G1CZA5_9ORYZ|nr:hypothetical protein E2562_004439 [Oryza meyeriana var. granulata]
MVITNRLLLPTTDFYITQKDVYLSNDLARAAKIDLSKAVYDSIHDAAFVWHENDRLSKHQTCIAAYTPFLVLMYIENLHLPQDNGVDPMHTPRIELYTKDMVEQISQLDRTADEGEPEEFGQLVQPVIDVIGVYGHQKNVSADEIAKQIYLVQTRQAAVYDQIIKILNDNTSTEKKSLLLQPP